MVKRHEQARKSLAQLANAFDKEHIQKLKPRTQEEYRRLFRLCTCPHLGRKRFLKIPPLTIPIPQAS